MPLPHRSPNVHDVPGEPDWHRDLRPPQMSARPLLFRTHLTCLGDKALLDHEIPNVVRPIAAEAEAREALAVLVDEFVFLHELAEVLENLWESGRDIDLLLRCGTSHQSIGTREA